MWMSGYTRKWDAIEIVLNFTELFLMKVTQTI